jgi:hypothetical protein
MTITTVTQAYESVMGEGAAHGFERPPSDLLAEARLPEALRLCSDFAVQAVMGPVMAAVIGIQGPEETEETLKEHNVALFAIGVRVGQALAAGTLDLAADELDRLDSLTDDEWDDIFGGEA